MKEEKETPLLSSSPRNTFTKCTQLVTALLLVFAAGGIKHCLERSGLISLLTVCFLKYPLLQRLLEVLGFL